MNTYLNFLIQYFLAFYLYTEMTSTKSVTLEIMFLKRGHKNVQQSANFWTVNIWKLQNILHVNQWHLNSNHSHYTTNNLRGIESTANKIKTKYSKKKEKLPNNYKSYEWVQENN
jgi:hypothetical protein